MHGTIESKRTRWKLGPWEKTGICKERGIQKLPNAEALERGHNQEKRKEWQLPRKGKRDPMIESPPLGFRGNRPLTSAFPIASYIIKMF